MNTKSGSTRSSITHSEWPIYIYVYVVHGGYTVQPLAVTNTFSVFFLNTTRFSGHIQRGISQGKLSFQKFFISFSRVPRGTCLCSFDRAYGKDWKDGRFKVSAWQYIWAFFLNHSMPSALNSVIHPWTLSDPSVQCTLILHFNLRQSIWCSVLFFFYSWILQPQRGVDFRLE